MPTKQMDSYCAIVVVPCQLFADSNLNRFKTVFPRFRGFFHRLGMASALLILTHESWKITINTTRGEQEITQFLNQHGIPFEEFNRNSDYKTQGSKPVADMHSEKPRRLLFC